MHRSCPPVPRLVPGALAFAVHPGGIFTPLQRHLPKEEMVALGWIDESESPTARFRGVNPHACSDESAEKLWAISEELLAQA